MRGLDTFFAVLTDSLAMRRGLMKAAAENAGLSGAGKAIYKQRSERLFVSVLYNKVDGTRETV